MWQKITSQSVTNHKWVTRQPAPGVRVLPGLINSHPDLYPDDPYPVTRRVLPTRANHYQYRAMLRVPLVSHFAFRPTAVALTGSKSPLSRRRTRWRASTGYRSPPSHVSTRLGGEGDQQRPTVVSKCEMGQWQAAKQDVWHMGGHVGGGGDMLGGVIVSNRKKYIKYSRRTYYTRPWPFSILLCPSVASWSPCLCPVVRGQIVVDEELVWAEVRLLTCDLVT